MPNGKPVKVTPHTALQLERAKELYEVLHPTVWKTHKRLGVEMHRWIAFRSKKILGKEVRGPRDGNGGNTAGITKPANLLFEFEIADLDGKSPRGLRLNKNHRSNMNALRVLGIEWT